MKKLLGKLKKKFSPRKKTAKRTAKKAVPKKSSAKNLAKKKEEVLGVVTHFYGHIKVAVVRARKPIRTGTKIRFRGATTDFVQPIASMQYDHKPIATAPKGKQVGMKVKSRVREGDKLYPAD